MENIIYAQGEDGRFFRTDVDIETSREHANFVIQTSNGLDWSGFRTLPECERQFTELEGYTRLDDHRRYRVVER